MEALKIAVGSVDARFIASLSGSDSFAAGRGGACLIALGSGPAAVDAHPEFSGVPNPKAKTCGKQQR